MTLDGVAIGEQEKGLDKGPGREGGYGRDKALGAGWGPQGATATKPDWPGSQGVKIP